MVVVEDGQIVAERKHEQLLMKADGRYHALYAAQAPEQLSVRLRESCLRSRLRAELAD